LSRKWLERRIRGFCARVKGEIAVLRGKVKILEDTIEKVAEDEQERAVFPSQKSKSYWFCG